jgi:hypothetical protein
MNAAKLCVWYSLEENRGGKSKVDVENRGQCMCIDVKKAIKKDVEPALNNVPITNISLVVEAKDGNVQIEDDALMQNVVRDYGINAAMPVIVTWQKLTGGKPNVLSSLYIALDLFLFVFLSVNNL